MKFRLQDKESIANENFARLKAEFLPDSSNFWVGGNNISICLFFNKGYIFSFRPNCCVPVKDPG